MVLITGGVKTGKSTLGVNLSEKSIKKNKRKVKINNFFRKLFKRKQLEEPLLYSNIPLAIPYVELTEDLLLRKKRFRYKSVIYVNEASLLANSQLIQNMDINERLSLFNKLIGHELKGGTIIYDTQQVADNHYSVRRCLSNYLHIVHKIEIPFFLILKVRECIYSDDASTVNAFNTDAVDSTRMVLVPKSTWKKFDAYCYSYATDDLPVEDTVVVGDKNDLRVKSMISFNKRVINLYNGGEIYEKTHD